MDVEVSVALNFIIAYSYTKLPRRRVDMFGEELEKGLKKKFEGHWYPDKPFKGSAFRCIRVSGEKIDPVMEQAASASGLDIEEVKDYLPKDLTVWIDPLEVSYRIGEKGMVKVLYSNKRDHENFETLDKEIQAASKTFNPDAQCFKPIDSLSSSLSNLSASPSSPTPAGPGWGSVSPSSNAQSSQQYTNNSTNNSTSPTPITSFLNRNSNKVPTFTTAMFAQTKFGSTKLKSQAKRPSRLSPTEFGAYIKHRSTGPPPQQQPFPGVVPQPAARPRTLSPRDARPGFMDHPHHMFLQHPPPGPPPLHPPPPPPAQQPQPQPHSSGLLSPLGGSLRDLYSNHGIPFSDIMAAHRGLVLPQGSPSPDGNKAFLDAAAASAAQSLNGMPPYQSLQHLLVAN